MASDMSGKFIAFDEASKIDYAWLNEFASWDKAKVPKLPATFFITPKKMQVGFEDLDKPIEPVSFTTTLEVKEQTTVSKELIKRAMEQMIRDQQEYMFQRERAYAREHTPTRKAFEILRTPEHWCQRSMERYNGSITAKCAVKAIMDKWGMRNNDIPRGNFSADLHRVAEVIRRRYPGFGGYSWNEAAYVARWNDQPQTRYEDVISILKEADV